METQDKNTNIKLDLDPSLDPMSKEFSKPFNWSPELIEFYFNKALKTLNKENYATSKEYIDMLVNQCLAERSWNDAFSYFLTKVKEMGLEIETEQDRYKQLSERLFYWRTVRMMIHAAALMPYEEEIMKYEISKYYQPLTQMPTLPPIQSREIPNARRKAKK